ncbi:hypothetical protein ACE6H2_011488 [Prunus campanulata]
MHKEGLRWQQWMCVQVCCTVPPQGHEKEERLASLPMLVVVLFWCITVACLVEDFEGAQNNLHGFFMHAAVGPNSLVI